MVEGGDSQSRHQFDPRELDIVRYTAGPNIVNCANKHVGRSYRLFPKLDHVRVQSSFFGKNILEKINALTYTLSHDLRYLLPDFDVKTGIPKNYERIIRWPSISH